MLEPPTLNKFQEIWTSQNPQYLNTPWKQWLYNIYQQGTLHLITNRQEAALDRDINKLLDIAELGCQQKLLNEYLKLSQKPMYQNSYIACDYLANAYDYISSAQYLLILSLGVDINIFEDF
ncbi:hypothetical protein H6F47_23160 [Sphaerospermopsis sp. FACHB-1094]|uniref:Uncharacterized protein n=1 Tax=Sphaerospermopsis reniformis TaxID=531300 RepID=A0A479ZTB6_9CYAN|nr:MULTISPECIES: hypothetical protein [Sphaerospermopsis]MBD2135233.1 hypothetical protein [Sphaerospermopsis sp. FACHB-1094]GCL35765.1 hypothetical protein SR1949_08630 [Sphaerospermopsis reniformis]